MVYCIVIYPTLKDNSKIQLLRKKYDPTFQLIQPHITLVFPFPETELEKIKKHINKILKNFKPFKVRLTGLETFAYLSSIDERFTKGTCSRTAFF